MSMNTITLNGKQRQTAPDATVATLITELGLDADLVVAEYNRNILQREEYETTVIADGAEIELIRFVGGG
ncbi:MAG: sulfur carrier protein ThiS [Thermodesulfobacteriota bacterium]